MNTRQSTLVTAISAFIGGFAAGLFYASEPGRQAREQLSTRALDSSRWLEARLHAVEAQLRAVEARLHHVSDQISTRMRSAADRASDHYVPQAPDEWTVEQKEMARELRRMPRKG